PGSHFVTLYSKANLNYFPNNTALSFTNLVNEQISIEPTKDYEVALTELHLVNVVTESNKFIGVKCSIATKRQSGEQFGNVVRVVFLQESEERVQTASDYVSGGIRVDRTRQPVNKSWSFAKLQYSSLD